MKIDDQLIYEIIEAAYKKETEKVYFFIGKISKLYKDYIEEKQSEI